MSDKLVGIRFGCESTDELGGKKFAGVEEEFVMFRLTDDERATVGAAEGLGTTWGPSVSVPLETEQLTP